MACKLDNIHEDLETTVVPDPVAIFEISGNNCNMPCAVTFINNSENTTTYLWAFGDGASSTDKNVTHFYEQSGNYTVELVANGNGKSDTLAKAVTIVDPDCPIIVDFSIENINDCKAPCTLSFTNTSENANSFLWDYGDGTTSTGVSNQKTYQQPGEYFITLTASDGTCEKLTTRPITVGWNQFTELIGEDNFNSKGNQIIQIENGTYLIVGEENDFVNNKMLASKRFTDGSKIWEYTANASSYTFNYSVTLTSDEDYFIMGGQANIDGISEALLLRLNDMGEFENQSSHGEPNFHISGNTMISDNNGGVLIVGTLSSVGLGDSEVHLIKAQNTGSIEWTKTINNSFSETGYSVVNTTEGGYLIAGSSKDFGTQINNVLLLKINASGNLEWRKKFDNTISEIGYSIINTTDGGYAIAGITDFGSSNSDVLLIKTDAEGNLEWRKTFGTIRRDGAYSIIETSDGGLAIGGYIMDIPTDHFDAYLLKTDNLGNQEWSQTYGGSFPERIFSIIQTLDGGYALCGDSEDPLTGFTRILFIKTDDQGEI